MKSSTISDMPDFTQLGEEITVPIDEVVPYWRNPRVISDEAVNAVAASIERYGYQQPVVVDENNVIIIGHTRTTALRRLGFTKIPVVRVSDLTPAQVKQLRIVDNRSAEYGEWDHNALADELSDLDGELVNGLVGQLDSIEAEEAERTRKLELEGSSGSREEEDAANASFVCPSCFHSWDTQITEKDVASGVIKAKGE